MKWSVSDWVHGKTGEGEMVYGFVEDVDFMQGLVTLYVVKSDHEERVGRSVSVRMASVKPVPESATSDIKHSSELIDLALLTRDKGWFMELTEGLGAEQRSTSRQGGIMLQAAPVNRLGKFIR